jgi:hypothetical protein
MPSRRRSRETGAVTRRRPPTSRRSGRRRPGRLVCGARRSRADRASYGRRMRRTPRRDRPRQRAGPRHGVFLRPPRSLASCTGVHHPLRAQCFRRRSCDEKALLPNDTGSSRAFVGPHSGGDSVQPKVDGGSVGRHLAGCSGAPGRIRTCDLDLRTRPSAGGSSRRQLLALYRAFVVLSSARIGPSGACRREFGVHTEYK